MTAAIIVAAVAVVVIAGLLWALLVLDKRYLAAIRRAKDAEQSAALWERTYRATVDSNFSRIRTMRAIADATRDGKSGTARKVYRMAEGALK